MKELISVIDLSLNFQGQKLFDDVNLSFTAGNCYGVSKANGAGKEYIFENFWKKSLEPDTKAVSIKNQNTQRIVFGTKDHFKFEDEKVIDIVIMGNERLMEIIIKRKFIQKKIFRMKTVQLLNLRLNLRIWTVIWSAEANASSAFEGLGISKFA